LHDIVLTNSHTALREAEEKESEESIDEVLRELATDSARFPAEPLDGDWI
jgi:hypothetical protein